MIEIEFAKLIGTHEGQVRFSRGGKVVTQTRRLGKKPSGRTGTGRIDKLPDHIKNEILDLRGLNFSGAKMKDSIETYINNDLLTGGISPNTLRSLIKNKIVSEPSDLLTISRDKPKPTIENIPDADLINQEYSLKITPQGLTDWAKKHGAGGKTRKTMDQVKQEVDDKWKSDWNKINEKNAMLTVEIQEIRDRLEAADKDARNKQQTREKLRSDLRACRAELGQ